jgi:hypothetical protein
LECLARVGTACHIASVPSKETQRAEVSITFGNAGQFIFLKFLIFLLKIKFFYILNCFDALISKIIFKK